MNIQIKSTRCEPEPRLLALAEEKVAELTKFFSTKADVAKAFVELEKAVGNQQTGKIWRAEINVEIDGERFRAESTTDSLEKAIHKAYSDVGHELKQYRKRHSTLVKKGGAVLKSLLRGFRER